MELSDEQIANLQAMVRCAPEARRHLERCGISLTPANFYSTVPSVDDIERSFEYATPEPFLVEGLFDAKLMRQVLSELCEFGRGLDGPREDDPDAPRAFFWNNGQFMHSDAAAYYAFIRSRKPRHILEIGAGYSTLVASAAVAANGVGEIICVEPFPRPFLESVPHVREIVRTPAQALDPQWVNELLVDGDVLFIDSTHTVKIGSDCLHLYLRLLPALRHRVLVQVHDIFLPDGMPKAWALDKQIYWTEQYLLLAYLLDNPKVRVLYGSNYHRLRNRDLLAQLAPPDILPAGGSFWFERVP
jgi:predicted O-methyltransferase YrrM